jgi:cytochrome b subunit of formate dehydrogenase
MSTRLLVVFAAALIIALLGFILLHPQFQQLIQENTSSNFWRLLCNFAIMGCIGFLVVGTVLRTYGDEDLLDG